MVEWRLRNASAADQSAIAEVAAASGLDEHDSGRDPSYVQHLLWRGRVILAATLSGTPVGFAASIPVGRRWMLTDLFVRPDMQNRGAGSGLLAAALRGASSWMTFSSKDARAMSLYVRAGARPQWPLLYLRGQLRAEPGADPKPEPGAGLGADPGAGLHTERVEPERAAAVEATFTGVDRTADYRYWTRGPRDAAYLVWHADRLVGAACISRRGPLPRVAHFATAPEHPPAPPLLALLSQLDAPVRVCLPGGHPATATLARNGFHIEEFDVFMIAGEASGAHRNAAYDPGLF